MKVLLKIFIAQLNRSPYTKFMNLTIIILLIIGGLWFAGTFFGFIGSVPKAFKNDPSSHIDSSRTKSQSQDSIESTEEKRQRLMEDMKQRISDQQRRY